MQRVIITSTRHHMRYHTFSLSLTWLGHNAMHYRNFSLLPHTISYIFTQFSMVLGQFATRYHALLSNIFKKVYINIFLKKIDANAW